MAQEFKFNAGDLVRVREEKLNARVVSGFVEEGKRYYEIEAEWDQSLPHRQVLESDVHAAPLAEADFKLGGTGYNGRPIDETVHAELHKSGAFQYGNGTCMTFEWSNGNVDSFDTRYEKVTPDTFTDFAGKVLRGRVMDTVTIEAVKRY